MSSKLPPMKLDPLYIDAFMVLRTTDVRNCAVRGCKRRKKVRVLWKEKYGDNQSGHGVCYEHAIDLANQVLEVRKFGHKRA